jgi:trehalose 6-phosphate phosphatase
MSAQPPIPADYSEWMRRCALFLDIDGTLLDLAPTPDGVQVPPGLTASLRAIARGLGGSLALVSGRALSAIDRFFPGGFDAAGTHGAEWRLDGALMVVGPDRTAALAGVSALLQARITDWSGVLLEPKPRSLAIHYRLAPERGAAVRSLAGLAVRLLGADFRLQTGKSLIEILPASADKGAAIRRFMEHPPYAGRRPVFVGDDLTDEVGFAAVNALDGYSIRVGDAVGGTCARYRLDAPCAVRDWLAGLVAHLSGNPMRVQS